MEKEHALAAFSALGQETRLDVFRLLVKAGQEGMAAGAVSEALNVRANTLSTHLSVLSRSGLVHARRDGRSIVYQADMAAIQNLVAYLLNDCCGGKPELCAPLFSMLNCGPAKNSGDC